MNLVVPRTGSPFKSVNLAKALEFFFGGLY
jgi:hypothetical protein